MNIRAAILLLGSVLLTALRLPALTRPQPVDCRARAEVIDRWLKIRLDTVLPRLMSRENIDMWLVICREYNEDPVFFSLVPSEWFSARRSTILVFQRNDKGEVDRRWIGRYAIADLYQAAGGEAEDPFTALAALIANGQPRSIAVNRSSVFGLADGLSATLEERLHAVLPAAYRTRLVSGERLVVGWLETRIDEELEAYPHVVATARAVIAEAFSSRVICPGITRVEDVRWWIRERITDLGLAAWFHPTVSLQRRGRPGERLEGSTVIHRGDLLHCDVGLIHLRLASDTQEHAYVLLADESDAPRGLRAALHTGNQAQDILMSEFRVGRSGNDILKSTLDRCRAEGIRAAVYSHPLGFHGHGAGPAIGLWDHQEGVPGSGDYPIHPNTCYAIELNVKVSVAEWDDQVVMIGLEQDAVFQETGMRFMGGRQTRFHLIH